MYPILISSPFPNNLTISRISVYLSGFYPFIMEPIPEEQVQAVPQSDMPAEVIVSSEDANTKSTDEKQDLLIQAVDLSPGRAGRSMEWNHKDIEKIQDPERSTVEFVSNGLTGCHMDEILQQKSDQFIQKGRQIIILTAAGKPVYCYGREDDDLSSMG